jgi:glycosyltransferase involved in cell wall biosynthesis
VKAPRVLLLAEAANPEWVSVPLVGWSMASAIQNVVDAHIVTHVRNRDAFVRAGKVEGTDFTCIDTETLARPVWKLSAALRGGDGKGWTTLTAINGLIYPYFEHLVWKRFGAAIKAGDYDIVHRLTPLTPTVVSPMARKCERAGTPFVVGPLNGGVPWPREFDRERRKEREWLSYVRSAYKLLPGHRKSLIASKALIVGSKHTGTEMPRETRNRLFYMPENGIDRTRFSLRAEQYGAKPVRFCFIGRLVEYKGPDLALLALATLLRNGAAEFDIIGDGPMMPRIRSLIEAEGIKHRVQLHGWLEHKAVQSIAARSQCFVFPSVREFGGGAVLEAMALGLVPIVVDYGGPGELVDSDRGFKVPMGNRDQIIEEIKSVARAVVDHPERLHDLAETGREWVFSNFAWGAKAAKIATLYDWVLNGAAAKPDWHMALTRDS